MGFIKVMFKGLRVYNLMQHRQEKEYKNYKGRDGRHKIQNTAIQCSSNLWQSSCKNIQHLISKKYWSQETRQQNIFQNMGENYMVRGTCACITFWQNAETQIYRFIIHRKKNWIHNMHPIYAQ